jgi:addiction module RelE/StbE family toxin
MKIEFSKKFFKQRNKSPKKIQESFDIRLSLFKSDCFHSLLNFHELKGKLKGYYSINITGDWRAIFRFRDKKKNIVIFISLNTHSELYK